jgi:metal-sulfur cluster biosynthetic enzyme
MIKENANPILHHIDDRDKEDRTQAWLQAHPELIEDFRTRSVVRCALQHAAQLNAASVNLLKNTGLWDSSNVEPLLLFHPASNDFSIAKETNNTPTTAAATTSDPITAAEIFDLIRHIQDPEHPHSLEALGVVKLNQIDIVTNNNNQHNKITVEFTPTIPHCSMATLIGLCLSVKLQRCQLPRTHMEVKIHPGTHASEHAINKQLQDKERLRAALENPHLLTIVNRCIANGLTQHYSSVM